MGDPMADQPQAWTYTHLYFPHIDEYGSGWEYSVLRGMSLPYNMASLRKQFYFTLFYFATSVFALTNTALYWLVTLPHNDAADDGPGDDDGSGDVPGDEQPPPEDPEPSALITLFASPHFSLDMELPMTPTLTEMGGIGKTPCRCARLADGESANPR